MDNLNKKIEEYLQSLASEILALPALKHLNSDQRDEYTQKIKNHFSGLILQTALNRMTQEQIEDLQTNLQNPDVLEQKIEEYSAQIPGLADDIEARLQREFEMMKKTLSNAPAI